MATVVKSLELERVSHWIELGYRGVEKETLSGYLVGELARAGAVRVDVSAKRYRARDEIRGEILTEWRSWLEAVRPAEGHGPVAGVGPASWAVVREQACALLEAWIASPAFAPSRRAAFVRSLRREFSDNGFADYGIEKSRKALAVYGAELSSSQRAGAKRAVDALERAGQALERIAD